VFSWDIVLNIKAIGVMILLLAAIVFLEKSVLLKIVLSFTIPPHSSYSPRVQHFYVPSSHS
jgi:hypothetical protein